MNVYNTTKEAETKARKPVSAKPSNGRNRRRGNGSHKRSDTTGSLELRDLLSVLIAARDGDFTVRLPSEMTGLEGKIADVFNEIMLTNQRMAEELEIGRAHV